MCSKYGVKNYDEDGSATSLQPIIELLERRFNSFESIARTLTIW